MKPRFENKVAVVTGAASGIGRAIAARLVDEGAHVAAFDIDTAPLAGEDSLSTYQCDVSDPGQVAEAVDKVIGDHGGIDVLVNSAGIVRYGALPDYSDQDWSAVIGVNLTGVFHTVRAVVPAMAARGGGAIVNVASNQAFASQPLVAAYSATKGALVAMTRTIAIDHAAEGIRANAVAPGSVRTKMLEDAAEQFSPEDPEAAIDEWGSLHVIGRVIEPEEVAAVVAFLASHEASAVTGATYLCDGGLSIRLGG